MKKKSQLKRVWKTAGELALLLSIVVVCGFLLPIFAAPYAADLFSITTPSEAARQAMSVQVNNRNVSHAEAVTIGVSNPNSTVRMQSLSYSCDYPQIRIAYKDGQSIKEIPCGTQLELPPATQHRIIALTAKREITYMPINLVLANQGEQGDLSVVIAVAARDADNLSRLDDFSTAQLQTFPVR